MTEKESVKVLRECIDLQLKKSRDYQNPNSNVKQAMHYRRGIDTIHDTMQGKMYRAQSLLESGQAANFESLEDTYKDLVNYASFAVAWLRQKIDGQDPQRDIFNKPLPKLVPLELNEHLRVSEWTPEELAYREVQRAPKLPEHSPYYYDKDRNK